MEHTIIHATCDNDAYTACIPKYIILTLKWLTIAKLQIS